MRKMRRVDERDGSRVHTLAALEDHYWSQEDVYTGNRKPAFCEYQPYKNLVLMLTNFFIGSNILFHWQFQMYREVPPPIRLQFPSSFLLLQNNVISYL